MSAYSDEHEAVLAALSLKGIAALIEIVRTATLREEQFIRAKYAERATHFDATLTFLKSINCIRTDGNQLELANGVISPALPVSISLLRGVLMEKIAASRTPYRQFVAKYLKQFHANGCAVEYRPGGETRLHDTAVRDLLMEMQVIEYTHSTDTYRVNSDCADVYLWAKNILSPRAKTAGGSPGRRRSELGTFAELAVLDFERKRVGSKLAHRVEHTAAENPFACYDIKSVTLTQTGPVPRFIEVKAVARESYEFFWTAAEIEAALLLRDSYFLYLIPVVNDTRLDFENLLMIEDAYKTVRDPIRGWDIEENVVVCRKRTTESTAAD